MSRKSKLSRTIENVGMLKDTVRSMWGHIEHFKYSHEEMLAYRSKTLLDNPTYKSLPRWAVSEVSGFDHGYQEGFEKRCLEDRWSLDGKQYIRDYHRDHAFEGRWADAKYDGVFYIGIDKVWYLSVL
jgi:hypothetical protein